MYEIFSAESSFFFVPRGSHVSPLRLKSGLTRFVRDESSPLHPKVDAVKKVAGRFAYAYLPPDQKMGPEGRV